MNKQSRFQLPQLGAGSLERGKANAERSYYNRKVSKEFWSRRLKTTSFPIELQAARDERLQRGAR